jgi:uncharacterized protein YbcI
MSDQSSVPPPTELKRRSALSPNPEEDQNANAPGSPLAAISRRIVALVKEYYGKGPANARTYHLGDVVLVLLHGGYTPVEKTLLAGGQAQAVMDQRAVFQDVMRPRFKRVIEEELQREVLAFMSTIHHDPDLNAELFVLSPETEAGHTDNAA